MFLFILLVMFSVQAQADFTFDDFSDITGLQLNSAAVQSGNVLLLTPALLDKSGSVFFITKQFVRDGFETTFQFQITIPGGSTDCKGKNGGDGFAFLIQNSPKGTSALGIGGEGIGYGASACCGGGIANSLAVEFDTFCNSSSKDPNENHISVQTRGQAENSADHTFSLGDTREILNMPNMSDTKVHTGKIRYVPGNLSIFLDNLLIPVLEVSLNLSTILSLDKSTAWVGFTAATGTCCSSVETENHAILNWSFTAVPALCDIQMSKASYVDGDTVTAQVARLANPKTVPVPIELGLWFELPTLPPISFVNLGADGSFVLAPGFNQDFGPLPLAQVTATLPRGTYGFNCRIVDPVTKQPLAVDLNPFQIQ